MKTTNNLSLRLPWSPSANEIWRSLRGGSRPYLAPKYRRFLKDVQTLYFAQGSPKVDAKEPLQVTIRLFPPHNRSYDVDNRIKPTLDSLTKCGLWIDDRYVRRLNVYASVPVKDGAIVVEIETFDEQKENERVATLLSWYGLEQLPSKSKLSKNRKEQKK